MQVNHKLRTVNLLLLSVVLFLSGSQVSFAYADYGYGIFLDETCGYGDKSYVFGTISGSDNGLYPELTFGRVYFDWCRNGVLVGNKMDEDSTPPISVHAHTEYCYHSAEHDYTMIWAARWKHEDGSEYLFNGTETWEGWR